MNKVTVKILSVIIIFLAVFFVFPQKVQAGLNADYVELKVTYKKANGESCTADSDCSSGHCVDGYCCDTACGTVCEACDVSGSEGTCTDVPVDTDPHDDCDSACVDSCEDKTGDCDGAGACKTAYCSAGTACSATTCDAVNYCNEAWAYCSAPGDNYYNDGGTAYVCQGQCDGSNNCDYAGNCQQQRSGYCTLEEGANDSQIIVRWSDDSDSESGYEIERQVDGSGFAALTTKGADVIAHTDTDISSNHTYQYRIRPTYTDDSFGTWCTTAELNLGRGGFWIN